MVYLDLAAEVQTWKVLAEMSGEPGSWVRYSSSLSGDVPAAVPSFRSLLDGSLILGPVLFPAIASAPDADVARVLMEALTGLSATGDSSATLLFEPPRFPLRAEVDLVCSLGGSFADPPFQRTVLGVPATGTGPFLVMRVPVPPRPAAQSAARTSEELCIRLGWLETLAMYSRSATIPGPLVAELRRAASFDIYESAYVVDNASGTWSGVRGLGLQSSALDAEEPDAFSVHVHPASYAASADGVAYGYQQFPSLWDLVRFCWSWLLGSHTSEMPLFAVATVDGVYFVALSPELQAASAASSGWYLSAEGLPTLTARKLERSMRDRLSRAGVAEQNLAGPLLAPESHCIENELSLCNLGIISQHAKSYMMHVINTTVASDLGLEFLELSSLEPDKRVFCISFAAYAQNPDEAAAQSITHNFIIGCPEKARGGKCVS